MTDLNDAVVIEPAGKVDAAVIWLHGLGADGHDFEPIVPMLGSRNTGHIRFIFPHAPPIPVTINGGFVMRAWYDVLEMDITRRADETGVRASAGIMRDFIEAEIGKGIEPHRIVAAGFSQGGAVALHTGLRYSKGLAGILALSCYLPVPGTLKAEVHAANASVPLFMAHGNHDPVIHVSAGEYSRDLLRSLGYEVDWHTYPIPHSVSPQEIEAIAGWLAKVVP
jgi:phospholipase/carboxylesterase